MDFGNLENQNNVYNMLLQKIISYENIITDTFIIINDYKKFKILTSSEVSQCIHELNSLLDEVRLLQLYLKDNNDTYDVDNIIVDIQNINNKLSSIIKTYGTKSVDDMITICLGQDFLLKNKKNHSDYFDIITKYFHPISYKLIHNKKQKIPNDKPANKILEDIRICERGENCTFYDLQSSNTSTKITIFGVKLLLQDTEGNKSLLIYGYIDDIIIDYAMSNQFLLNKYYQLKQNKPDTIHFENSNFDIFLKTLSIKDYLINDTNGIYDKYMGYINNVQLIKNKTLTRNVNDFLKAEFIERRNTLIQLLLQGNNSEYQYLSYLLYDSICVDDKSTDDTDEQLLLYESLPWVIKSKFKSAMKQTLEYTNNLLNYDVNNRLPLEQRICLMKTTDKVKEKAMVKLKEVKSKTDDSGTKARQYLDGLLKIPFGVNRKEPIFDVKNNTITQLQKIIKNESYVKYTSQFSVKDKISSLEIKQITDLILSKIGLSNNNDKIETIQKCMKKKKKKELYELLQQIQGLLTTKNLYNSDLAIDLYNSNNWQSQNKDFLKNKIDNLLNNLNNREEIVDEIIINNSILEPNVLSLYSDIQNIYKNDNIIADYMNNVKDILDKSVYGHDDAKRQVERVIGQWVSGNLNGYCLGFEGPPGVGKCIAKDTPIMLSNGKIKMVQDITLKDKLMGDDGLERNVLALGSGREKMYRIEQVKGDDYVVNESHILSLKMTKAGKKGDKHQTILGKRYYKDDIVDICIKDYLGLPKYLKECLKGYKVGLDFREQDVCLEPYALGYWLGDGHSNAAAITTIEKEVIDYFEKYTENLGLQLKNGIKGTKNEITYRITSGIRGGCNYKRNSFLNSLKQYKLINNKHIPEEYKLTTRENRLSLLAGLIDSDGYYNPKNNSLEITQKNKVLADDIVFLVRSLGMRAMIKECEKSCTYKGEKKYGIYHRITISGYGLNEIPVLLKRKKARPNKQKKNCLNTGIKLIPLEEDKYYGFQIDGNSRFLLGDFTVTHNTSMAKNGLSKCLKDDQGESRPFSFIAIGGSSNGSTLEGHNYTYVGSTWGRIVDILIEQKCMNPIIFIDELDKVSRTESGREIISILTHLIDPTQNDTFQDKYFSGIDLDLSKVLFVFSYNDIDIIDRILLDRIHRIKFDHLTVQDKLIICKDHMLPEIYDKMGQCDNIVFSEEVLKFIIEKYTYESGVRKLKEILYEIVGEVNLTILKNEKNSYSLPINITIDDVKQKYLKKRHYLREPSIHPQSSVGIITGLWANAMGKGGIIPIQSSFILSSNLLDLKLTGMQGDVMKESMNVAKTLAWSLTDDDIKEELIQKFEKTKTQGIHIHCPEGAVPKDGPSAGTAITVTLYSLLNNKKIKNTIAITGEINLQGRVTAIGGLDLKILGGLRAGVKTFLFPKDNEKDYHDFLEKYSENVNIDGIGFHTIETIDEALKYSIEE